MNTSFEEDNERALRSDITGKALTLSGGIGETGIRTIASDEDRARLDAEKAEAMQRIAQSEQSTVVRKKRFRCKGDRVLVRPLKTAGEKNGVIIAESARYLTAEGEVLAVGPGARNRDGVLVPTETKVGDIVKYTPYTGSSFKLNDEDVLVLREGDLLGDLVDEEG